MWSIERQSDLIKLGAFIMLLMGESVYSCQVKTNYKAQKRLRAYILPKLCMWVPKAPSSLSVFLSPSLSLSVSIVMLTK